MSDGVTESVGDLLSTWETYSNEPVHVVVAGKKGSGKTTLYSALCGIPVQPQVNPTILLNNEHTLPDYDMTVTDACGLSENGDSHRSDLAIKIMRRIQHLADLSKVLLIYTISINQADFPKTEDKNEDIRCMKRLTTEFGEQIWRQSVIALTFTNEDYASKKSALEGESSGKTRKSYIQEVLKWKETILECMKNFVLHENESKKVPIVPVGLIRHSLALANLEYDLNGESWVLKMWRTLAERAPQNVQHKLLSLCFQKTFQNPFYYFDSYLGLIKVHGQIYQKLTCTVEDSEGCQKIGLAYSYLRILKQWYDNFYEAQERNIKCSKDALDILQFWRNFKRNVKILVTGAKQSGKTALINSLLYGKCQEPENPDNNITCPSEYKRMSVVLQERSLQQVQEEHSLPSSDQVQVDDISLILVCIMLNDTEEDMRRTLGPIAKLKPRNLMVVLTFANVNLSEGSWNEYVQNQTKTVKTILTTFELGGEIVEGVRVVPASYHSEPTITGDHSDKNWIMNTWLNSLASSEVSAQPALAVFINYFLYGGSRRKGVLPGHKKVFREYFLQILHDLTKSHKV